MTPTRLHAVFAALHQAYGRQRWWPADGPFEVMVGAVLTQNTAWTNVEKALVRLRARIPLEASAILALDPTELADALRPSGYFNVKARRLRAFCEHYLAAGELESLEPIGTPALREWLLEINGVGYETADDILLYAFERPVFVVDSYTRRIFTRIGWLSGCEDYEAIRRAFESALDPDVALYKEYHAMIVQHAKQRCRTQPKCRDCILREDCREGRSSGSGASPAEPLEHISREA